MKVLLLAVAAAVVSGQQIYRERVDVSRVLIDVRVLDDDGKPIAGLKPADFAVNIDGKAARVDTLDWVSTEDTARLEARPSASPDAVSAPHGRWIIFLYQKKPDLSEVEGLMHIRHDLASFVDIVTPEDRVAVVSFDTQPHLWVDFTSDVARIRRTLAHDIVVGSPPRIEPAAPPALAAAFSASVVRFTNSVEETFRVLGDALEPLPGAKSIVVLGYGMGTWRREYVEMDYRYEDALRSLQKARVSVFCVDLVKADYHPREFGLHVIAEDTGGFYLKSDIFTKAVFDRIAGAVAGHYVLLVVPPDAQKGERHIDVALVQRHGNVIAKRAYVAE